MTETPAKPVRLQSTFIRGAAWGMAMRWGIKLLGLISTVILARIISPEDYGIVAMAMLFAGMAEVLVDFGAQINILRKQTLDRDFIDSAWSLQIIQGGFVATLLALSAPLAGVYFNEPRVVWVIWVIAACLLFDGLTNIGITLARKNFEFKLEFRYRKRWSLRLWSPIAKRLELHEVRRQIWQVSEGIGDRVRVGRVDPEFLGPVKHQALDVLNGVRSGWCRPHAIKCAAIGGTHGVPNALNPAIRKQGGA